MKHILSVIVFLMCCCVCAQAQQVESVAEESSTRSDTVMRLSGVRDIYAIGDTVRHAPDSVIAQLPWRPDPHRATWLAAIVPGLGQIYNRSYWKLPLVYGAFMGCIYAISWNNTQYSDYKQAYRDIVSDEVLSPDPTRSYNAILPKGYTIEMMGGRQQYTETLNSRQNLYRRYRDIAITATVVVYVLTIIDAYVDAQLFDYDISPDLSLNVTPEINFDYQRQEQSAGIHLALTF